ncbi:TetR family transcriptional regulator [Alkalihalophilus pseudofirmus]|nr:TetR family transcriptional regulator [Alkalihalophilus pseudofirmus]
MSPRVGLDTETIIKTAVEMADNNGVDSVTLSSLAKQLNIRPPSLYNHIEGLDELKKELAIHGLKKLYQSLVEADTHDKGDLAVRTLALAYVHFVRLHPGLYEATFQAPDMNDPDVQLAGSKIVDLVVNALSVYPLKKDEALHAVRGLRSILHGFSAIEQQGGFGLPLDVDVSLNFIIDTFIRGLDMDEDENKR